MEKKILGVVTIIFFIIMIVFTFVSRSTSIELLPEVETVYAQNSEALPETAVYTDEWGNSSVYILIQEDSILGTVDVAKSIPVEIKEKTDGKVIVDGISEMSGFQFIKDISAGINDGDRVRRADDGRA